MILVRHVYQAGLRKAHEAVDRFKQNADLVREIAGPGVRLRVLTDLSGPLDTVVQEIEVESFARSERGPAASPLDTVVQEIEVESLAEWDRLRTALFSNPRFQQLQTQAAGLYGSGRAEFYTIEATVGAS